MFNVRNQADLCENNDPWNLEACATPKEFHYVVKIEGNWTDYAYAPDACATTHQSHRQPVSPVISGKVCQTTTETSCFRMFWELMVYERDSVFCSQIQRPPLSKDGTGWNEYNAEYLGLKPCAEGWSFLRCEDRDGAFA